MYWALFNDMAQRLFTRNKSEQRFFINKYFQKLCCPPRSKILDFGCGTGLFTTTFNDLGHDYLGYDIDERLTQYAQWLHPSTSFMTRREEVLDNAPYDYVLANCCFHHIEDGQLGKELGFIKSVLKEKGTLVVVDILVDNEKTPLSHQLFMMLERGAYMRTEEAYLGLLQTDYRVTRLGVEQSHFFSMRNALVCNNLGIYECRPRVIQNSNNQ